MNQKEIDQSVAKATGEALFDIRKQGFTLERSLDELQVEQCCNHEPQTLDWDHVEMSRHVSPFDHPDGSSFGQPGAWFRSSFAK